MDLLRKTKMSSTFIREWIYQKSQEKEAAATDEKQEDDQ